MTIKTRNGLEFVVKFVVAPGFRSSDGNKLLCQFITAVSFQITFTLYRRMDETGCMAESYNIIGASSWLCISQQTYIPCDKNQRHTACDPTAVRRVEYRMYSRHILLYFVYMNNRATHDIQQHMNLLCTVNMYFEVAANTRTASRYVRGKSEGFTVGALRCCPVLYSSVIYEVPHIS